MNQLAVAATAAILLLTSTVAAQEAISSVTRERLGQNVWVRGNIVRHREPWSERAPHILTLQDSSGSVDLVFWADMYVQIPHKAALTAGTTIDAQAEVTDYRGNLQLELKDPTFIQPAPVAAPPVAAPTMAAPPAITSAPVESVQEVARAVPAGMVPAMAIGSIDSSFVGKTVAVRGQALQVIVPEGEAAARTPIRVTLQDSTGGITVVFWQDFWTKLPAQDFPKQDGVYQVSGEVGDYRGTMQLKPKSPSDFRAVQPGQSPGTTMVAANSGAPATPTMPTTPPPFAAPAAPAMISAPVAQSPFAGSPATTAAPPAFPPPGSAQIVMAPPPNAAPISSTPVSSFSAPPPSAPPPAMTSMPVTAPASGSPATPIAGVTTAMKGQVVEIEGQVMRVISTSYGLLLSLKDGSGSIDVFYTKGLVSQGQPAGMIDDGWTIRTRGVVAIYKDQPELRGTARDNLVSARP